MSWFKTTPKKAPKFEFDHSILEQLIEEMRQEVIETTTYTQPDSPKEFKDYEYQIQFLIVFLMVVFFVELECGRPIATTLRVLSSCCMNIYSTCQRPKLDNEVAYMKRKDYIVLASQLMVSFLLNVETLQVF